MRNDFDTARSQGNRMRICGICGRQFYEALIRDCPLRLGRAFCSYCCRRACGESYQAGSTRGCRAAAAARSKKKRGAA